MLAVTPSRSQRLSSPITHTIPPAQALTPVIPALLRPHHSHPLQKPQLTVLVLTSPVSQLHSAAELLYRLTPSPGVLRTANNTLVALAMRIPPPPLPPPLPPPSQPLQSPSQPLHSPSQPPPSPPRLITRCISTPVETRLPPLTLEWSSVRRRRRRKRRRRL